MNTGATGIIILAAGSSSRLGRPKQLLVFKGETLIKRLAEQAAIAGLHPIVVITGAYADLTAAEFDNEQVHTVYNANWETGMASGIILGLQRLLALNAELQQIIIAVCDQPFLTAEIFGELVTQQSVLDSGIVASAYADTLGTPVLFTKKYFSCLLNLQPQENAKKLLKQFAGDVTTVNFPLGAVDIDNEDDYAALLNRL